MLTHCRINDFSHGQGNIAVQYYLRQTVIKAGEIDAGCRQGAERCSTQGPL
jgi:hypothetical protein